MRRMLVSAAVLGIFAATACSSTVRQFGSGGEGGKTTTTTQTGGGATGGTGTGGTGTVYTGPKLVKSTPVDGDMQAGIAPYFLLYFDRPMSWANATGKISLTSDLVTTPVFAQVDKCPDLDATCVLGAFPQAFFDPQNPNGSKLRGSVKHTITVDKSFADPDGNTFDADVVVSFTTFQYTLNVFDDSAAIAQESGGLDYDPVSGALFLCGNDPANELVVRRIPVSPTQLGPASMYDKPSTVNAGGPYCYGLDIYDKRLYVSHTYGDRVLRYDDLVAPTAPNGPSTIFGPSTGLMPPDDGLHNIHSVAAFMDGTRVMTAPGYYLGYPPSDGILLFAGGAAGGAWSYFAAASGIFDASNGFTIQGDLAGGHVYVMAKDKILKLRATDALLENQHTVQSGEYDPQLRVDSKGRLYVGGYNGITVYDTAGTSGFTEITSRNGLDAGRFALVEKGNDVEIYFMRFRDKAILGRTVIQY
jgi:hypothetical protein